MCIAPLLPLCCASQTAEQAAAAAAERVEEQARQKREAQARAAQAQAERLGAEGWLQLEGHPMPWYNGVYWRVGQELHEGFPRYEHASSGRHLYRYQGGERWQVSPEFTPDNGNSNGCIVSAGGEVPVGAQAWRFGPAIHMSGSGKWEERTVTVRELVRAGMAVCRLMACAFSLLRVSYLGVVFLN